jgi:putative membrane protein
MNDSVLPHLNAALNATSFLLLVAALYQIRRGNVQAHRRLMLSALAVSGLFLVSYVTYHAQYGSVRFTGQGFIRPVYFVILVTHVILAAAIVPLVIITLRRALAGDFARHRRIARWTYPLWLYVSVTGVVVYLMLYQLYRPQ